MYNKYGHRNELYVKDNSGSYIASNFPSDDYEFVVKLTDQSPVKVCGFYNRYPNYPIGKDYDKLLPNTLDILNKLLSNESNVTIGDIYSRLSNAIAEEKMAEETKKIAEEKEFNEKNEELKGLYRKR